MGRPRKLPPDCTAVPAVSLCQAANAHFKQTQQDVKARFEKVDAAILGVFLVGILWVLYGVVVHAYYIPEIATQFFAIGLLCGLLAKLSGRLTINGISSAFQRGAAELLPAALIVGMAKGIIIILGGDAVDQPSHLNTLLFYASGLISDTSNTLNAVVMLTFQSIFNFFVASGSGQAAITMPLMAPLADLIGVTRQTAVLAFQLGDGLSNIIIPTSASLIGCLGVARIDWSVWFKFAWKFFIGLFLLAAASMMVAVNIGYQ
ncbi:AbgT family transporter [Alteromonas sp. ASW11-36]|uniref:AbgT family transporter n=1 Tax=Alteromonas arenosi TaxID=3055817 RepID=A0ABT7SVL5_9ALTE|nr:AbgT family transporter [Alteromonas sp. ASW11-36]MDM7859589.1 AbgT family transporter [Alteromonas sp. ASW11-36]